MRYGCFLFIYLLSFPLWAKSPIREACGDSATSALEKAETIDDLKSSICRFMSPQHTSKSVIGLSKSVLAMVEKVKKENNDPKKWQENQDLENAIRNLAEAVKQAGRKTPPKNNSPLGAALNDLTKKYGTWPQRMADQNGYVAALKKAVLMTKKGPEVFSCFSRTDGTNIKPAGVVEFPEDEADQKKPPPKAYGGTMAFVAYPMDEANPKGDWGKSLVFDWKADPMSAVTGLQHELKHACNATEHVSCQKKALEHQDMTECDQLTAVDELRAYKFESEEFLELAKASPELVCSTSLVSLAYGKIPVRLADFIASNEEKIADGSFVNHIVPFYIQQQSLTSESSFYEKTADGKKKWRADFLKRMKDAGFTLPAP